MQLSRKNLIYDWKCCVAYETNWKTLSIPFCSIVSDRNEKHRYLSPRGKLYLKTDAEGKRYKKFDFHKKDIAANASQSFSVLPNFSSIFLTLKGFQFSLRAVCNFLTFFLSMPHSGIACTIWRYYISFFGLLKYFHASMFCTIFSSATFLF